MSLVAASEPGGRCAISWYTTENFPQVVGKLFASMREFTDGFRKGVLLECGKEKFWISLQFPGLPGLGMMDIGEDWKGPIRCSSASAEKGPTYRPLSNSL
jgi:hypothetical protein